MISKIIEKYMLIFDNAVDLVDDIMVAACELLDNAAEIFMD